MSSHCWLIPILINFSGQTEVWWSSWISSAREKSVSALNATKRDLVEFVSVLGSDTKAAVKGASDNINKILIQSPSTSADEDDTNSSNKNEGVPVVEVQASAPYDRCRAELFAIQNNTETYLQDPQGVLNRSSVFSP